MAFGKTLKSTVLRAINALPAEVAKASVNALAKYYVDRRDRGRTYSNMRQFLRQASAMDAGRTFEQVKSVVEYAWVYSAGYRDYWRQHGFDPEKLKAVEDLQRIPTVNKEILRDSEKFSVLHRSETARYITTSGSTGQPLGLFVDKPMFETELAFMHDMWARFGFEASDRYAVLRGAAVSGGYLGLPCAELALNAQLMLSSYKLTPEFAPDYAKAIRSFKPAFLYGYPSSLEQLTRLLLSAGIERPHNVKFISSSSETLNESQREILSSYWGCPVVNLYSMLESVVFAANYDGGKELVAHPAYGWIEINDENGRPTLPGEVGTVVGTSFHMRQTPFIRYQLTDLAVPRDPFTRQDRPFVIADIVGRDSSFLVKSDGGRIPFAMVVASNHDEYLSNFRQFQFRQVAIDRIEFYFSSDQPVSTASLNTIIKDVEAKVGSEFKVVAKQRDQIERGPNGKYEYYVGLRNEGHAPLS